MKKLILFTLWFSILTVHLLAQDAYMNISHQGISPSTTITVESGQEITFEYGGGGPHPMTSGQGSTESPIFFPTVTVTSSNPTEVFSLTEVGTYLFHCNTNPGNTGNWGTIIVDEPFIEIIYGDVNLDSVVNVLDVIAIVNDIIGAIPLSEESFTTADVNLDSMINVSDIVIIVNIIMAG